MTRTNVGTDRRGQAALVGLVLLVGIVAIGSVGILLLGANANQESQAQAQDERVKQGFQELDNDIDAVARSENDSRSVDLELPSDSDVAVREDATGRIWINKTNFTTLTTKEIVNRSIGVVRYSRDDGTTYAFQGGGIFKEEGRNTRVLSPPAFAYELNRSGDSPTLTVPIVVTTGDERLTSGDVGIRHNKTIAPTNEVSLVENELVTVTVKSRWYVGWAQYFREIAPGGVTVNHAKNTATLRLVVPIQRGRVLGGLISGASGQTFTLGNNADFESYNSSNAGDECNRDSGSLSCDFTSDTRLFVSGNLEIDGNVQIAGDVDVGGETEFDHSGAQIQGDLSNGTSDPDPPNSDGHTHVTGTWDTNPQVRDYEPVDKIIDAQVARAKSRNNNAAHSTTITNIETDSCGPCVLTAGTYYVDTLELTSGTLEFDTTSGPITLVVNETFRADGGNSVDRIDVTGPNRVNIYINSESGSPVDFDWGNADNDVPDDKSPRFWVYMDKDAEARFTNGQADFYGVLFGPGDGPSNGVEIDFSGQAHIYGALVGRLDTGTNNPYIIYDEALRNTKTITAGAKVPSLTFLHASVYEVCLQDADQNTNDCKSP